MSCPEAEAIIKPIWEKYDAAIVAQDLETAMKYYHPDSVVVHKGTAAYYGLTVIKQMMEGFYAAGGKTTNEIVNPKYVGGGDWIVITADYVSKSEKLGEIKGSFVMVWRKVAGDWLIYHDEFEVSEGKISA